MIYLTDEQLDHLGVSALGARRKLLKVFHLVRRAMGEELPEEVSESTH